MTTEEAEVALYERIMRHEKLANAYARTLPVEGLDLVHDAYLRCLPHLRSGHLDLSRDDRYLIRALRTSAIQVARGASTATALERALLKSPQHIADTDAALLHADGLAYAKRVLAKIRPKDRPVAIARYNGLSFEEISELTDRPAGTLRSLMTHARARLTKERRYLTTVVNA